MLTKSISGKRWPSSRSNAFIAANHSDAVSRAEQSLKQNSGEIAPRDQWKFNPPQLRKSAHDAAVTGAVAGSFIDCPQLLIILLVKAYEMIDVGGHDEARKSSWT